MHYGVTGMRWGHRKANNGESVSKKKHIGIDDAGRINFINGKSSSKGKKMFVINTTMSIGAMSLSYYVSKHPKTIIKGQEMVKNLLLK